MIVVRVCCLVFVLAVRDCPSRLFFVSVALAYRLLTVFLMQSSRAGFVIRVVFARVCCPCLLIELVAWFSCLLFVLLAPFVLAPHVYFSCLLPLLAACCLCFSCRLLV